MADGNYCWDIYFSLEEHPDILSYFFNSFVPYE